MTSKKTTILITGASDGIGMQLAKQYASPNVHLILVARNIDKLKQVALICEQLGASTVYKSIEVQDALRLKAFLLDMDKHTPIDLIIANAGITSILQKHWQPEPEEVIEQVFSINVQGAINTINPLIPAMMSRKKGQIAIVSSLAGFRGVPQSPSYCASKAALRVYGQALRAWLGRFNIKVSVICPGYVDTKMISSLHAPRPFMISSEKAALFIQRGLAKNKACIAFPWPLYWLTKGMMLLPSTLIDMILNCFESYKSSDEPNTLSKPE